MLSYISKVSGKICQAEASQDSSKIVYSFGDGESHEMSPVQFAAEFELVKESAKPEEFVASEPEPVGTVGTNPTEPPVVEPVADKKAKSKE